MLLKVMILWALGRTGPVATFSFLDDSGKQSNYFSLAPKKKFYPEAIAFLPELIFQSYYVLWTSCLRYDTEMLSRKN